MQKRLMLAVTASLLVTSGVATAQEPSPEAMVDAETPGATVAGLPPDGSWQVTLSIEELMAAGAPADGATAGIYTWTFAEGRAGISVRYPDGGVEACAADMAPVDDAVRLTYDPAGCGGEVDVIRWALDDEGLHLSLVETNAPFDQNRAYLEAKPWQPVAGDGAGVLPRPTCPNPYGGGSCLGPLEAGTYETMTFRSPFSYTVPEGWANYEDLPGGVLLLPPDANLDGIDDGTSDYVGIAQGVGVGMERGTNCDAAQPGVGLDPASMVAALSAHEGIIVSDPVPVEIGGLAGLMIDVADDPASDIGCAIPGLGTVPGLIVGIGPADFAHSQGPGFTTRLYLLDRGDTNIVIEVSDVTDVGGTAEDYAPVIESIEFDSILSHVAAADQHIMALEDVASVLPVKDPFTTPDYPVAAISRADCPLLMRVVADDGSSQEFMACSLSDEPFDVPENQGTVPTETLTYGGGECIWSSDYHGATDGLVVMASAFEVTVLPSGRVAVWSSYPAEPLDCSAG